MADSLGPPPAGGDVSRAPTLLGVYGTLSGICVLCTVARLYARFRLLRTIGVDDIVIIVSTCLVVTDVGILAKACSLGLGRHEYYLSPEQYLQVTKWTFMNDPFGIIGVALPKLAIVIFLARIVGRTKRYQIWALYFLVSSLILLSVLNAIFVFAQCNPPKFAWDPTIKHKCWKTTIDQDYSFFVGALSALCDLTLALFPAGVIFQLQMSMKRKLGISLVMGLGIVACVCAIVRTTTLATIKSYNDWSYRAIPSTLWATTEMNIVIICACIPTFLPLVQQLTGRKDYLSRPKPGQEESGQVRDTEDSKRSLWNSINMRPLKSQGTIDSMAYHDEGREGSLPEGEIRTTTELQTKWEAV